MAGIYIHIPFCKSKCGYCDFYSVTKTDEINNYIQCLEKELILRKKYLENETIETIYFGGGTPSLLNINQIKNLTEKIYDNFEVIENPEITLEANPDDLNSEYLAKIISETKINRLSIGIQSFFDDDLRLMKRRHNSSQAVECVENAKKVGFKNISIDLIYGLPNQTIEKWNENIEKALKLNVQHISAYHLTYEKGTGFYKLLNENKITEINEDISLELFKALINKLKSAGFEHYEISNFAQPGYYSKHNTSYWQQKKYLGLGPSAHSFDLNSRQWNYTDLNKYSGLLIKNEIPAEIEIIDQQTKYNEYIMTSLRTMWGVNKDYIFLNFDEKYRNHFIKICKKYVDLNLLTENGKQFILSAKGIFISDSVIADFFVV